MCSLHRWFATHLAARLTRNGSANIVTGVLLRVSADSQHRPAETVSLEQCEAPACLQLAAPE